MDFIANDWKAIQRCLIRLLKADGEGLLIEQEGPMLDALVATMDKINPEWVIDTALEEEELRALFNIDSDDDEDIDDEDNDEDGW